MFDHLLFGANVDGSGSRTHASGRVYAATFSSVDIAIPQHLQSFRSDAGRAVSGKGGEPGGSERKNPQKHSIPGMAPTDIYTDSAAPKTVEQLLSHGKFGVGLGRWSRLGE